MGGSDVGCCTFKYGIIMAVATFIHIYKWCWWHAYLTIFGGFGVVAYVSTQRSTIIGLLYGGFVFSAFLFYVFRYVENLHLPAGIPHRHPCWVQ